MAGSVLGKLLVELGLDASDFKKGLDDAEKSAGGFGGKVSAGGKVAAAAVGGIGLAAAAGLTTSIMAAAGFEQQLSQVAAVSGATGKELDGLHDTALRIGKETAFSASESAKAMEILAQNGLSAQQIMNGAADATVALAAAGGTDLATAADVASTAMGVWKLGAEDMADVVNRVAGAANVSRFGVEDMSLAIGQGAAAAKTFGVDFADFTAAIAGTATSFNSGADAGTSFKTFMMSIAAPAGAGKDKIAELGLEFRDALGNMKPMAGIVAELEKKLGGLNQEARDKALRDIFGSDALRMGAGLLALADGTGTATENFEKLKKSMGETDAAAIAKVRMDNLAGAMESFKGSLETIQIQIGEYFLPVLTALLLFLADKLPEAFDALVAGIVALGPTFEMIKGAVLSFLESMAPVGEMVEAAFEWFTSNEDAMMAAGVVIGTVLVIAFGALAIAIGAAAISAIAFMAPFLLVAVAIGLVVAAVVLAVKHWDELIARFPILEEIKDDVVAAFKEVARFALSLGDDFLSLAKTIGKAGEHILNFLEENKDAILQIIEGLWTAVEGIVKGAWKAIQGIIEGALKIIEGVIKVATGILTGDWELVWDGIKEIVSGVWRAITSIIQGALTALSGIIRGGMDIVSGILRLAWDLIENSIIGDAIGRIKGLVQGLADKVQDAGGWIGHYLNVAGGYFTDFYNMASAPIKWLMDKIDDLIGKIRSIPSPGSIIGSVGGGIGGLVGLADGAWSVPGPRSAGDSFPALLAPGEMVVPANIADTLRSLFTQAGDGGGYSQGGPLVQVTVENLNALEPEQGSMIAESTGWQFGTAIMDRGL